MRKGHPKSVDHPPIITVGELIDELCRLPDTAVVHFRCPVLGQELAFERLRKRSNDDVEIAIHAYPEGPTVAPSPESAFRATRHAAPSARLRNGAVLNKVRS